MRRIIPFLIFVLLAISVCGCNDASSNNHRSKFEGSWKLLSKESGIIHGPVSTDIDLIFFDENEGIAPNSSQVNQTVNGGKEWTVVHEFKDLLIPTFILDEDQNVWGVGARWLDGEIRDPIVVRSKDKGRTWSPLEIDFGNQKSVFNEPVSFRNICFTSPKTAWLTSDVGLIETSVSESNIRIEEVFRTEEELYSVSCSSSGRVIAAGRKGAVYRYDDRGLSRLHPPSEFTFSKVKQIDNNIWLMGHRLLYPNSNSVETGESGVVLFSADAGATWEDRTPKQIRFFSDINLRDGKGWLTGSDGNLFYSDDNGKSWRNVEIPTKGNLYNIFFLNERNIWIGGVRNTVLKYGID